MLKFSWRGLGKAIVLAILLFSHVFIGLYVFANIIDWKIDFLNINPSETSNERHFPIMTYPPSNGSGFQIVDSRTTIIFEDMYLRYKGTPTANKPFELSAIGTLDPEFAEKIHSISVYFDGALPYPIGSGTYTGSWGISLYPTMEEQNAAISLGAFLVGSPTVICWQVEGDYYLSVTIRFENFTDITQKYEGYKDFCIHIDSANVLEQQKSSRITTSIAVAGAFFTFVDGSILIGRFLFKGKKKGKPSYKHSRKTMNDNSKQPTNKPESKPNKSQPYYKKLRDKSKIRKQGKNQRETNQVRPKEDNPKR